MERTRPQGFWQSVTGTREWGESALAAAHRELQEETGFSNLPLVDHHREHRFPILSAWADRYGPLTRVNRESLFSVCLDEPQVPRLNPDEHLRFDWVSTQAACERVYSWTNRQAIGELMADMPSSS